MFGFGRQEKAAAAAAAAAKSVLGQLRSVERRLGLAPFAIESDPYSIGFLIGYGLTAGNFAVNGRLEPAERMGVMKHIIKALFASPSMEVPNRIIDLHNSRDRAYHDGLTFGGKTGIVSLGLSLKDDDPVYIKAKAANDELARRGMQVNVGGVMLDLYFSSLIDDKRDTCARAR